VKPRSEPGGDEDLTVLMTGAGAPGASGILEALRLPDHASVRVVGVDMNPGAYGFELVDEAYTVPAGGDDGYVARMSEIVDLEGVDVVLPLTTAELQPLAENRGAIDAEVMVSRAPVLTVANDKGALYEYVDRHGFDSAPEFYRTDTEAGFVEAVEALGYPESPVCFKRPVASGMRGFRVLDRDADRLSRLLSEKPSQPVTTLEEVCPVLSSGESFPELVVMEYLPGPEYSVDVLAMGEEVGPVIPRTRARTRAGITFQGTVEKNDELIAEASDICRSLGLEYNVNLQFRYDGEGAPKLIEINPRVAGTIVMCVGAGVNLPFAATMYALDEPIQSYTVEWGTSMVRYWQELFRTPDGTTFHVDSRSAGDRRIVR